MKAKYRKILKIVRPGTTEPVYLKEGVGAIKKIDVINYGVRIFEVGYETPYEVYNCPFSIEYEKIEVNSQK